MHKRGLIYAAVFAALVSATAALPATAQPSQPPPGKPAEPQTVTLITGDKVTVTKKGDTWDARIEPAWTSRRSARTSTRSPCRQAANRQ